MKSIQTPKTVERQKCSGALVRDICPLGGIPATGVLVRGGVLRSRNEPREF